MRISFFTFGLLGLLSFCITGCDVIDDPVIPLTIGYRGEAPAPSFEAMTAGPQHVLLEDFTAHQCGNCPPAGALAEQLSDTHDGRLHVLAVHAGSLAAVSDAPFDTDWTNAEANAYWSQLAFQVNPIGRVNRRGGPTEIVSPNNWSALVDNELGLTPCCPHSRRCHCRSQCLGRRSLSCAHHIFRSHHRRSSVGFAPQRKPPHCSTTGLRERPRSHHRLRAQPHVARKFER